MATQYGIDLVTLRKLVIEAFRANPETQINGVLTDVGKRIAATGLFPSDEECRERGVNRQTYKEGRLNRVDEDNVVQIAWDLVVERVLTPGHPGDHDRGWPFLRLTPLGRALLNQTTPQYYDPDGYLAAARKSTPGLDPVIEQYLGEALRAFQQGLLFASAVMLGAAAEKAVLLLLDAIGKAHSNPQDRQRVQGLLDRGRLPAIYTEIDTTVTGLEKSGQLPYQVHQGSLRHLLSLFDMIRVQRNDAVHPHASLASREKVLLSIQGLPAALECVYRLVDWFSNDKI